MYEAWLIGVFNFYDLRHHFGFHHRLSVYVRGAAHMTDAAPYWRNKVKIEYDGIAREHLLLEFNLVDLHKIGEVIFRIRDRLQHKDSSRLRHRLDLEHAGHYGGARKMPLEKRFIHR